MNGPYLDLAPHYQRNVVWTRKAMCLLIDSMWRGYYIPPVGILTIGREAVPDQISGHFQSRDCGR